MALRTPHVFIPSSVSEVKTGKVVDTLAWAAPGGGIRCQITPLDPATAYEMFGVEAKRPHLMLANISDTPPVKQGDRGTYDSRTFEVKEPPMKWAAGKRTNCWQILLVQLP